MAMVPCTASNSFASETHPYLSARPTLHLWPVLGANWFINENSQAQYQEGARPRPGNSPRPGQPPLPNYTTFDHRAPHGLA